MKNTMQKSKARNHHYVSQAEQRLNALNPEAKPINQRIYQFNIETPEPPTINLVDPAGKKIEDNLALRDLYALKMLEGGGQHNLEETFQTYENDITQITKNLLLKLDDPTRTDLKIELIRLYLLKMLNSFRNPNSVKKTISLLEPLIGAVPRNKDLRSHFESLDKSPRTQTTRISAELGVSRDDYLSWLKILYLLLLQPLDHGMNLLEHFVKSALENPRFLKIVNIHRYDRSAPPPGILLGDRGWVEIPNEAGFIAHQFNIDAFTLASFEFIDMQEQKIIDLSRVNPKDLEGITQQTRIYVTQNKMEALEVYNRYTVWQSKSQVYSATTFVPGVKVNL